MARDSFVAASRLFFAGVEPERLELQFQRYPKRARKSLRRMARTSPRLGDLTFTFPAAAVALAFERGTVVERQAAMRLVKSGAPLMLIASALRLPWWTRRLPPEAFQRPFGAVFDDAEAARRLMGSAPPSVPVGPLATWFEWINAAHAMAEPAFVYWLARRRRLFAESPYISVCNRDVDPAPVEALGVIAVWAFFSQRREGRAGDEIMRAWSEKMTVASAATCASSWLERVARACQVDRPESKAWRRTQCVSGYKFAPRYTPEELTKEGRVMRNCVGTYAQDVADGECLIFAIRRGGAPVATMEIALDTDGAPYIAQLEAPENQPAPQDVRRAAEAWLKRQGPCPLRPLRAAALAGAEPVVWEAAFAPFFEAVPRACDSAAAGLFLGPADARKAAVFQRVMRELHALSKTRA